MAEEISTLLFGPKPSDRKKNDYIGVFMECPKCEQMVLGSQIGYHYSIFHAEDKSWEQRYYER